MPSGGGSRNCVGPSPPNANSNPSRGREKLRLALEAARTESPPPSLMQIARRPGFSSEEVLLTAYPEICASHRQWCQEWREEQRASLRLSIREWLAEQPASALASYPVYTSKSPRATSSRTSRRKKQRWQGRSAARSEWSRERRADLMRNEVFEIVRETTRRTDLSIAIPSEVGAQPGSGGHTPRLRPAIDEAIEHFGPIMRHRSELGQFA